MIRRSPASTLFPYTTLFRSLQRLRAGTLQRGQQLAQHGDGEDQRADARHHSDSGIRRFQDLYARSQRRGRRERGGPSQRRLQAARVLVGSHALQHRSEELAMTRFPGRQRGATLIVSLIMLLLITLLAVSSFTLGKANLQIVGNIQQRELRGRSGRGGTGSVDHDLSLSVDVQA